MHHPSHLVQKNGLFYARFRVPSHLVPWMNQRELRWSLNTGHLKTARRHLHIASTLIIDLFSQATMELPDTPFTASEKARIQNRIEEIKLNRLAEFRRILYSSASGPREATEALAQEQWEMDIFRSAIESNHFDGRPVRRATSELIEVVGRVAGEFSSLNPNYNYMAKALCEAMLAQNDAKTRMLAESLAAIEQMKLGIAHEQMNGLASQPITEQQPLSQTPPIEKLAATHPISGEIKALIKELESNGMLSKSIQEITTLLKRFEDFCHDADIESITRQDLMEFRAQLKNLPKKIPTEHKGKDFNTVTQLDIAPKIGVTTINKHLEALSRLFRWAASNGRKVPQDVAYKTALKDKRRESDQREAFSSNDLKIIFSTPEYLGTKRFSKAAYYWAPLIALYSGMRIEEICQLNSKDIFLQEGTNLYCIDINETNEDMRLKTASSKRVIPVHKKLLELGLIEYVKTIKQRRHQKLFPTLAKHHENGYGHSVGKWFSNMKIKLGFPETKVFHSFRHTLADTLKQAGIEERYVAAIVGHKSGEISFERYAKEFKPEVLEPIVNSIEFDIPAIPYSKCLLLQAEARALKTPTAAEALKTKRLADRHSNPHAKQADADIGVREPTIVTQEPVAIPVNERATPERKPTPAKPIPTKRPKRPVPEKKKP